MASLQCLLLMPLVLRAIRYRWKMSWQTFFHSGLYLLVQAMDTASMEATVLDTHPGDDNPEHMAAVSIVSIVTITMAATVLSLASTAILTPPVYMGDHVSARYLYFTMVTGCVTCDVPFVIMRLVTIYHGGFASVSGIIPFVLLKNIICILILLSMTTKRIRCLGTSYRNLAEDDSIRMIVQSGMEDDTMHECV